MMLKTKLNAVVLSGLVLGLSACGGGGECGGSLQTFAAFCSAIGACAAAYVAWKTFTFQKNLLLKKLTVDQILKLLQELQHLKSLTGQGVLSADDSVVTTLGERIAAMKENILLLESMVSDSASIDLRGVRDFVHKLREDLIIANDEGAQNDPIRQELDAAINKLQNVYHKELK